MFIPALSGLTPAGKATAESQTVSDRASVEAVQSSPVSTVETPAPAELAQLVSRTREAVREVASNLEFSVDSDTGKTVVRVVDASTRELIRQIPSEEMLSITRNIDRVEGLLIKSKA
jgi:flagellar protein FlaG